MLPQVFSQQRHLLDSVAVQALQSVHRVSDCTHQNGERNHCNHHDADVEGALHGVPRNDLHRSWCELSQCPMQTRGVPPRQGAALEAVPKHPRFLVACLISQTAYQVPQASHQVAKHQDLRHVLHQLKRDHPSLGAHELKELSHGGGACEHKPGQPQELHEVEEWREQPDEGAAVPRQGNVCQNDKPICHGRQHIEQQPSV
mmetsp:Transcript_139954/g.447608  ORF Transcript_139954/g.447608 Transcript_139954/m.447608 type:complete len:201 (-) Transcript_139954:583-1185(-)